MIGPSPEEISRLIVVKLNTLGLPRHAPSTIVTRPGRGDVICAVCDRVIRATVTECVCEVAPQSTLSFHFDCFREWRHQAIAGQAHEPAHADSTSSAPAQ